MNQEDFIKEHKKILLDNNLYFIENCDYWATVTGLNYYKDDGSNNRDINDKDYLFTIKGFNYDSLGCLDFDFEQYLKVLKSELKSVA